MSYEDDGTEGKGEEKVSEEEQLKNDRIALLSSKGNEVCVDDEADKALALSQGLRPDPIFGPLLLPSPPFYVFIYPL